LFADVLLNPIFPADALERERGCRLPTSCAKGQLLKSATCVRAPLFGATATAWIQPAWRETVPNSRRRLESFHKKTGHANNA